ncbi:MAG: fibronectin type III domain-containing protein, partial [Bacteroidota bacterium]|nr:fibronectin type III domain-containing protein [Bacteroidota bacterium]
KVKSFKYFYITLFIFCLTIPSTVRGQTFVSPQNLSVKITDNTIATTHLTWEFSNFDNRDFLGFKVYRNGSVINGTLLQNAEYTDNNIPEGTYRYKITALYHSGESTPSNRGIVTISESYHFQMGSGNPVNDTWTIYIDNGLLGETIISPGDELAIFDGTEIVGRHKFLTPPDSTNDNISENGLVAFSEINPTGGYNPGNTYNFKLWDASTETLYENYEQNFSEDDPQGYNDDTFPLNDNEYSIVYFSFAPNLPSTTAPQVSNMLHDIHILWEQPQYPLRDLVGYDIYRNNEKLNIYPTSETEYIDNNVPSGEYNYHIICIYDEGFSAPSEATYFQLETVFFTPSGDNTAAPSTMNLEIHSAEIMGVPLIIFDEIAVYKNSICIAAKSLNEPITEFLEITIPEDNPNTPEIDGFASGDKLYFRFYDYDKLKEYQNIITKNNFIEEEDFFYAPSETAIINLEWIPYAPQNLSSSVNEYNIFLQWEESPNNTNLTLQGFDIYRDNEKINSSLIYNNYY